MARAASTTSDKNDNTADPAQNLDAEIAALREDVAAITATLGDIVKQRTSEARTEAQKMRRKVEAQGEEALESVRDGFETAESEIKDMIREKPITSVLIAAGVGYVLSKIL